jgi:hypothetical protein
MKVKETKVYIADDGKTFTDEVDCILYEKKLEEERANTTYWQVVHTPDLTEGRGYYGLTFLKVKKVKYISMRKLVEDFCYRTLGRPMAFVMGCSLMENWILTESTETDFNKKDGHISVGDYSYAAKYMKLELGSREEGLIVVNEDKNN